MAALRIHTIVSQPFDENTYVLWREGEAHAAVVDPGLEPELILDFLREQHLEVSAILNTHGHADHIGGNAALKRAFPAAPIIIGSGDSVMLVDANANLSLPFGIPVLSPPADRLLHEGDSIETAGHHWEVLEIPGHSPGHIAFHLPGQPGLVLGGDVLFRESIGRTDFPGGSFERLEKGIRAKIYTLPDETVIYPGHGPVTTVGHEKRNNPFVRA